MGVTKELRAEHRLIEKVMHTVEQVAELCESRCCFEDLAAAQDALTFLREFVDGLHHRKEERVLFPAMREANSAASRGPLAAMLREHDRARSSLKRMAESLEGASQGDEVQAAAFAQHARAYLDLLRVHIAKEDSVIFPMADRLLSEGGKQHLGHDMLGVEREAGPSRVAALRNLGQEINALPAAARR